MMILCTQEQINEFHTTGKITYTQEQIKSMELQQSEEMITELQLRLDNDYRFKKYIDGEYSEAEWAAIAKERRAWRNELRELLRKLKEDN